MNMMFYLCIAAFYFSSLVIAQNPITWFIDKGCSLDQARVIRDGLQNAQALAAAGVQNAQNAGNDADGNPNKELQLIHTLFGNAQDISDDVRSMETVHESIKDSHLLNFRSDFLRNVIIPMTEVQAQDELQNTGIVRS
jgi:hypothetical protein